MRIQGTNGPGPATHSRAAPLDIGGVQPRSRNPGAEHGDLQPGP